MDYINFAYTEFKEKLDLTKVNIKDEANFLNIKIKNLNRETARIIKHSFEKQDNIIEANKFYALEMKERAKELNDKNNKDKNFIDWLVFKIHGISSNHSQDWILALFWIINITLVTTFLQFELAEENILFYFISITIISLILLFIGSLFILEINKNYKVITIFIFSCLHYITYSIFTNDYNLCFSVNNLNPFSIMTGKETLTIGIFIYKIIIAYLIYQFIISIRQNTRRK